MTIKELFAKSDNGSLTYEEFEALAKTEGTKFADLSTGNYVSKSKYDSDLNARDEQIKTLSETITSRDTDLADLKTKLEASGEDASKISNLTESLTALQSKYDTETKQYEDRLSKQAYEFAVREYANEKKFSSKASKRDFIQSMIAENLKLKDGKIIGADDFVNGYMQDNEDAFIVETPDLPDEEPLPQFVGATPGGSPAPVDANDFVNAFHFTGVR